MAAIFAGNVSSNSLSWRLVSLPVNLLVYSQFIVKGRTMSKRRIWHFAILLLITGSVNSVLMGQATSSGAEKQPELLSGLDQRFIDSSADPCADFFKYACGKFTKYYPIPNDRSGYGTGALVA